MIQWVKDFLYKTEKDSTVKLRSKVEPKPLSLIEAFGILTCEHNGSIVVEYEEVQYKVCFECLRVIEMEKENGV